MKKIIQIYLLCTCLLFLGPVAVFATRQELLLDGNVQHIFTSEDGLLSTSSTAIAQTSDGFIWIGGYGGLVRYDGRDFETIGQGEIANISDLLAGENGELWIASSDSGIYHYQDGSLISLFESSKISEVESLAIDAEKTVWFGTENGIGRIDDENHASMLEIPELSGKFIHRILCTKNGTIILVARSGELYSYDHDQCKKIILDKGTESVRSAFAAEDGSYYIGTSGNTIWHCDSDFQIEETITAEGLKCINDLSMNADGLLWICSDNGIAVWQDQALRIQRMKMDNSVDLMMTDFEGNHWFVSSRQGVLEVSESRFVNISQSAGLDSMVVNAIQKLGDRLYVGHDEGLLILDAETYEVIDDTDFADLQSVRIRCLYADADGNLWIGTRGKGLLCYLPDKTWKQFSSEEFPVIASDNFRCIYDDGKQIFAGTDAGAYVVSLKDGVQSMINEEEDFSLRVLSISSIGDTYYLGTDGYGLYMVKDGKIIDHTTTNEGLNSNVIMKFCESRIQNGLWLVTGNKISYIDVDGTIRNIDKFPSSNNLDFLILNEDEVWVFTGNGILQTTEESLLSNDDLEYKIYKHADGMPYEIVPNSNQCLTDDALYICGAGGISSMDLASTDRKNGAYHLAIDQVRADGENILISDASDCVIAKNARRIEIGAHVLTYQSDNPTVFYELEGFDQEQIKTSLRNLETISYTNLKGGSYLFHFGILDSISGEILQEITLPIHKEYQWFERKDVRAAGIIAVLALLTAIAMLISHMHTKKMKQKLRASYEQEEKQRLHQIAYSDYLTGLYNRNFLEIWNEKVLPETDYPVTFLSADCNNLKKINDTCGHKQGDRLLQKMAELLKKHFSEEMYYIIRMGGDEFLVLCCGVSGEDVRARMEQVRAEAAGCSIEGIPITFGYGICTQSKEHFDFEEGLRLSDMEMLKDKDQFHGR